MTSNITYIQASQAATVACVKVSVADVLRYLRASDLQHTDNQPLQAFS